MDMEKLYSENIRECADLLDKDFKENLLSVIARLANIISSLVFQIPTGK